MARGEKKEDLTTLTVYWRYETSSAHMRVTSLDSEPDKVKVCLLQSGGVTAEQIMPIDEFFEHVDKLRQALKKEK